SALFSQSFDTASPSVVITDDVSSGGTANGAITFTFTFSEAVSGFTADAIDLSEGSKGAFSGAGSTYTLVVTPPQNSEGSIEVSVPAAAASDAAGNGNQASELFSQSFDTTAPVVLISDDVDAGATANGDILVVFNFSEAVSGFSATDIQVSGGTAGSFNAISESVYTLVVSPPSGSSGNLEVSVPAGVASDAAGNGNQASALFTQSFDTISPTVVISDDVSSGASANGAITFTFTFSEAVSDFTAEDIDLSAGSKGAFSGAGSVYTLEVIPPSNTTGSISVAVPAGAAVDAAGNGNLASAIFSQNVDTAPPTLTISDDIPVGNPASGSITFSFSFSEAVADFSATDIQLSGGTAGAFTAINGSLYTLVVTPPASSSGSINVVVPAGAASDAAGNASSGSSFSQAFDTASLTVVVSDNVPSGSANGPIRFEIRFSDPVSGLTQDELLISGGGSITSFSASASDKALYNLVVTPPPNSSGSIGVAIPAGAATAADGRTNSASAPFSQAYDTTRSDPTYPLTYTPAEGSAVFSTAASSGSGPLAAAAVPLSGSPDPLQLFSLASWDGVVDIGSPTSTAAVQLYNPAALQVGTVNTLNDGVYTNVPILALTLPGSTAPTLNFNVRSGQIDPATVVINAPVGGASLINLAETQNLSGTYILVPDVFSTGILAGQLTGANDLLQLLPFLTVRASTNTSTSPLRNPQTISAVWPQIPVASGTDPSDGSYPKQDPTSKAWALPVATDNGTYSYFNVPVASSQSPLNPQTTATVTLSAGRILAVTLNQPLYFTAPNLTAPPVLTLDLQAYYVSNGYSGAGSITNPTFGLAPQAQGLNNLVDDSDFRANPSPNPNGLAPAGGFRSEAAAVWLAAGATDAFGATPSQAGLPVVNRVVVQDDARGLTYLNATLNGGQAVLDQSSANSLLDFYEQGDNPYSFSAASTPAAITVGGTGALANANIVFWVEASNPVVPRVSSDGTESFQAFMEALYGDQRINYRVNLWNNNISSYEGWDTPALSTLYKPDNAVIRHLQAFNVQVGVDGSGKPINQTLVVWDEISIAAIKDLTTISLEGWIAGTTLTVTTAGLSLQVGDLISGNGVAEANTISAINGDGTYTLSRSQSLGSAQSPVTLRATDLQPATVLKAGFINPNASSDQWGDLFADGNGNSTIQTIPWDSSETPGFGIESITAGTQLQRNASGEVVTKPVLSWNQAVRTPYREAVLQSQPFIYLDLGALAPGDNSVNLGSESPDTTTTFASDSGLNFAIHGALPKSSASAVQNIDGTGVLATGTGSFYAPVLSLFNNASPEQLAANGPGQLQGSISGTTLTVTERTAGTLRVGEVLTGAGLTPGTRITAIGTVDAAGLGTYTVSEAQTLPSTSLLALPVPAGLPYASFSGSISGSTLTLSQLSGVLRVGDQVVGEGILPTTTITAIGAVDASGNGSYTVSREQTAGSSSAPLALVGTPSSSAPYTVEFWTQLGAG
ncbi:MAG: hypothetical protein RLZZ560_1296, partial [Cyanobacteriota bacterium]